MLQLNGGKVVNMLQHEFGSKKSLYLVNNAKLVQSIKNIDYFKGITFVCR